MPCGVPLRKLGSRDLTRSCSHLCLRLRTSRPFNVTLQLIYLIRGGAPLLKLCDARRINFHGDFDVKNKFCNKHLFLSGAQQRDEVGGRDSPRSILASYQGGRQTPSFVPPVADGPGVSLISACGDGELGYPDHTIPEIATA
jgi:hypothetical protein